MIVAAQNMANGSSSRISDALGKYIMSFSIPEKAILQGVLKKLYAATPGNGIVRKQYRRFPYVMTYRSDEVGAGKTYTIYNNAKESGLRQIEPVALYSLDQCDALISKIHDSREYVPFPPPPPGQRDDDNSDSFVSRDQAWN